MPKAKESMSNVDTAWLHMDRPTNLMMICGFMTFDEPLDYDRVLVALERRLLVHDRFRRRVTPPRTPLGNYSWEIDPNFDIRSHVQRIALPPPGDKAALQNLMSDIISTPLDRSRPLWHFYVVDGYRGGSVLAARLHHAIADGIALMRVLLSLTDLTPDAPLPDTPQSDASDRKRRSLLSTATRPAISLTRSTIRLTDTAVRRSVSTIRHPTRVVDLARSGADGTLTLARMTLRSPDPDTILKGKLGTLKRTAWSDPMPLAEVKGFSRALGGTINDVMLALVTGALRRYMLDQNQVVDGLTIRALVPVNLRPLDEPLEMGNRFGLVFATLPIGSADIHERFIETRRHMNAIKDSPEAVVAFGVLQALGMTPVDIESVFLDFFGSKSSAVMTNVPGPQVQLYFAGSPLREIMAWVPQSGGLGLGVSILSYNGSIMVGVTTDAGLVPEPDQIITDLAIEYEAMRQLTAEVAARASSSP